MSQNRVGLTFEALIHENKKRPNNRLQKMLNQKLQNLDSMKNESERMHRKTMNLNESERMHRKTMNLNLPMEILKMIYHNPILGI